MSDSVDVRLAAGSSRAAPMHAELAKWLIAKETDTGPATAQLQVAANRVCQKLSARLSRLVSDAGSQATWARALHLARHDFPFLDRVTVGMAPDACLDGVEEGVREVGSVLAASGLQAVVGLVLDLLAAFIGEDLTLRLVREVWPELPSLEASQPRDADGQEAFS